MTTAALLLFLLPGLGAGAAGFSGENCAACHASIRDQSAAPRLQAEGDGDYDVIVVGGGISGLTAAHFLKDEFRVLVLEKEDRPGGEVRREPFQSGRIHPVAATRMGEPYGVVQRLFKDLKISPSRIARPEEQVFLAGRFLPPWWQPEGAASLPYDEEVRDRFRELIDDLRKIHEDSSLTIPIENCDLQVLRRYSKKSFHDYLRDHFGKEAADLGDLYSRGAFGVDGDEVAAAAGLMYLSSEMGDSYSFEGGLGAVGEAMAAELGDRLKLGRMVERVSAQDGGVLVESSSQGRRYRDTARAVVLAVPAMVSKRIAPGLSRSKREALGKVRYSSYLVVALDLSEPVYSGSYTVWTPGLFFTHLSFPANHLEGAADDPGQTIVAYVPLGSDEGRGYLQATDDEQVRRRVLRDLDKVFPGASDKVRETQVVRWGHAEPIPFPRYFQGVQGKIEKPEKPIFFSGVENQVPVLEGAVYSGHKAAKEVREFLLPGKP